MKRAVIYARYSSEHQREASIEDQVRLCRAFIERHGWDYLHAYTDRGISGASPFRPGYQELLQDARAGRVDVVVAEGLDRLSRDQQDVAGLYKQLAFAGIQLITIAEGEISELHVGLKGTMNARLVICGSCGNRFASVGRDYLACGAARNRGTCDKRQSIRS